MPSRILKHFDNSQHTKFGEWAVFTVLNSIKKTMEKRLSTTCSFKENFFEDENRSKFSVVNFMLEKMENYLGSSMKRF